MFILIKNSLALFSVRTDEKGCGNTATIATAPLVA